MKRRSLAAEEFTFLRSVTDRISEGHAPLPTLFANLWTSERSRDAIRRSTTSWPTSSGSCVDEVRELARLGCTLHAARRAALPAADRPGWRAYYEARGWPMERASRTGSSSTTRVIDAAPGVTFGFHLCKGNQDSRWLVAGGYDDIAAPIFRGVRADRLLLEYDDERSGSFEPLRGGARRQAGGSRARDDEVAAARDRRRGSRRACARRPRVVGARAAGARHAVRLRHVGGRQRAEAWTTAGASSRLIARTAARIWVAW